MIKQCWANGTVLLQYGMIEIRYNIRHIKPYKYDTNVEYIKPENMNDDVNILITSYILLNIYYSLE